ncbi:MAG: hypothetical protein ACYCQJ_13795 [Nitrososphaerales archaeon]
MQRYFPSATQYTVNRYGKKIPSFSTAKEDLNLWYRCADPKNTVTTYYAQPLGNEDPNIILSCKARVRQDPDRVLAFLDDRVSPFLYGTYVTEDLFFRDLCLFPPVPSVNIFQVMILLEQYFEPPLSGPAFQDSRNGVWYGQNIAHDPEPIRLYLLDQGMNELASDLSWLDHLPKYHLFFMISRGCCRPLTDAQLKLSFKPLTSIGRMIFPLVKDLRVVNYLGTALAARAAKPTLENNSLGTLFDSPFSEEDLTAKLPEYLKFLDQEKVDLNKTITVDDKVLFETLLSCTDNQIISLAGDNPVSELSSFPSRVAWVENVRGSITYHNPSRA